MSKCDLSVVHYSFYSWLFRGKWINAKLQYVGREMREKKLLSEKREEGVHAHMWTLQFAN